MTQGYRRRLVALFALVLVGNTTLAPIGMAHVWFDGHASVRSLPAHPSFSQDDTVPPCHGHSGQSQDPTDHRPESLPCCAGSGCSCVSVPVPLAFFGGGVPQTQPVHDRVLGMACASAPQALPDSLLRPPIS